MGRYSLVGYFSCSECRHVEYKVSVISINNRKNLEFNTIAMSFIPRRDSTKQIPKEVQLFLLMSYFVLGNVYWTFNLLAVFCLFETPRMFYPPKGLCKADTEGGPIVFYLCLISVRKRILDFQNPHFQAAFLEPPECFI